jgi:hypothetical protein
MKNYIIWKKCKLKKELIGILKSFKKSIAFFKKI